MMGSLALCCHLPRSVRNFAGAVVTNGNVGLEGFVSKESWKLFLTGTLKSSYPHSVLFELAVRTVG